MNSATSSLKFRVAFTIVELLVVITIIALLLALLTPALDTAIEKAELTVCAANLDAWSNGIQMHAADHKGLIIPAATLFGDPGAGVVYPNHAWVYSRYSDGQPHNEWNAETMSAYVGGFSPGKIGGPWYCPLNTVPNKEQTNDGIASRPYNNSSDWGGPIVFSDYAYFGRISHYRSQAPWPDDLADRHLGGAQRVLMSDVMYRNSFATAVFGGGHWWYNHGVFKTNTVPDIPGINQMYTDGSVEHLTADRFDPIAMENPTGPGERPLPHFVSNDGTHSSDINDYGRWDER